MAKLKSGRAAATGRNRETRSEKLAQEKLIFFGIGARAWILSIGLLVIPIAGWPTRYFDNQVLSAAALLICASFLAVLWAIDCLCSGTLRTPNKPVLISMIATLSALILSTAIGIHPLRSLIGNFDRLGGLITWLGYLGLFFFAASRRFEKKELYLIARFAIAGALIASLLGIVQSLGLTPTPAGLGYERYRAYSSFGNPILFASYLALMISVGPALSLEAQGWQRSVLACLTAVPFAALMATLSRGGIIGALIAMGIFAFPYFARIRRSEVRLNGRVFAIALVTIALIAAGLISAARLEPDIFARFNPSAFLEGGAKTRLLTYEVALSSISKRPLVGYGPESFEAVFMMNRTDRYVESEGIKSVNDRAHNIALDLAVEGGFMLLIAFGGMVAVSLSGPGKSERDLLIAAIRAGSAGYIVSLLFSFGTAGAMGPFFAFLAISSANARGTLAIKPRSPLRLRIISAGIAAAFALLIVGTSAYVSSAFNYKRGTVLQRQGDFRGAIARYESAISLFPWEARYFRAMGWAKADLIAKGKADETTVYDAYRSFERSVELDPTDRDALFYHALFNLSFLASERTYIDEAKSLLERNVALDPYSVWSRAALADTLDLMSEKERASAERERAIRTALRFGAEKDPFISKVLYGAAKKLLAADPSNKMAERFLRASTAAEKSAPSR